ncbi:hypothetical protein ACFE04_013269 [Oxalis oulophora]
MGTLSILVKIIIILLDLFLLSSTIEADQGVISARLLDLYIRDYTFKSFDNHMKTGKVHTVHLPENFTTIKVDTARFRCGSLNRYGARLSHFHLRMGVIVQPCVDRVMMVAQNLGTNWSSIYYSNYDDLSGYRLISPVLGLLAYNADAIDVNTSNPFELGMQATITIDFTNTTNTKNISNTLCVSFGNNGKLTLKPQVSPFVCSANKNGHFALVMESPSPAPSPSKKISPWKVAVGTSIGSALGAFLLGLLLVAMFARVKKKARMEEIERRAYEEEALQVTMVGHVRAPLAGGSRTVPTIEHEYHPS